MYWCWLGEDICCKSHSHLILVKVCVCVELHIVVVMQAFMKLAENVVLYVSDQRV